MKKGTPVILCVGSDKILGDSVGPLVGDLLKYRFKLKCFVYGRPDASVNGKNLTEYTKFIAAAHPESPVIAVDACLSESHSTGDVHIKCGGINPKRAVTRAANPVGDVGVLGVIEGLTCSPLSTLMSVSWDNVEKLCYKIAFVLYSALSA